MKPPAKEDVNKTDVNPFQGWFFRDSSDDLDAMESQAYSFNVTAVSIFLIEALVVTSTMGAKSTMTKIGLSLLNIGYSKYMVIFKYVIFKCKFSRPEQPMSLNAKVKHQFFENNFSHTIASIVWSSGVLKQNQFVC